MRVGDQPSRDEPIYSKPCLGKVETLSVVDGGLRGELFDGNMIFPGLNMPWHFPTSIGILKRFQSKEWIGAKQRMRFESGQDRGLEVTKKEVKKWRRERLGSNMYSIIQ